MPLGFRHVKNFFLNYYLASCFAAFCVLSYSDKEVSKMGLFWGMSRGFTTREQVPGGLEQKADIAVHGFLIEFHLA